MSGTAVNRLQLLAAAVLFSTGGAAIKAASLTGWQVACFRSAVAAGAILVLLAPARRNWSWRVPAVGCAYAATLVLYVLANKLTTAANAIFLQDTAPLYLLLVGPWLLKEPVHRSDLAWMLALAAGVALVFAGQQAPQRTAPDPLRGNLIALASGISWALTLAGLRWLGGGRGSGLAAVAAGNLLACAVCLPAALPVEAASSADWLIVGYLGIFQIGLAYVFLTRGMRGVPALEASLLLLAEPALNPLWSWWLHGERPANLALAGGALILAATAARILPNRPAASEADQI
jgi:drug/metabolite transporter (DMT)-like permease